MKKRVEVEDLRPGMYVVELDRPWPEFSPGEHGFAIMTSDQLSKLRALCAYVYIETDLEVLANASDTLHDPASFSRLDRPELELEMLKIFSAPGLGHDQYPDTQSMEAEIRTIRLVHEQAVELIDEVMRVVRLGRSIDVAATKRIISDLADSIIRNPDALVCFTAMRQTQTTTAEHGLRTCILALALGRHLGMRKRQLGDLGIGTLLHDIGKTQVPQEILECGHELSEEERCILEKHVADGVAILESTEGISSSAIDVARQHHERYDGNGYPTGLRENEIGQVGHIGAIVNYYDSLIHPRPGKKSVPSHTALKIMYEHRGKLFHPGLVEEFIRCMGIYPIGSIVEMRTGEVGVVVSLNRARRLKPRVVLVISADQKYFETPAVVDLTRHRNSYGELLEIAGVAEGHAYGFDPLDYLPSVA